MDLADGLSSGQRRVRYGRTEADHQPEVVPPQPTQQDASAREPTAIRQVPVVRADNLHHAVSGQFLDRAASLLAETGSRKL